MQEIDLLVQEIIDENGKIDEDLTAIVREGDEVDQLLRRIVDDESSGLPDVEEIASSLDDADQSTGRQ